MFFRTVFPALCWIIALVACDQIIKTCIINTLAVGEQIDILPFLALHHAQNTGIAFSLFSSFHDMGLIALTLIVTGFVLWLWWKSKAGDTLLHIGYLLIVSGALGNLIDRLRLHYVTDYVLFHIGHWSFAVFNLADAFITIGAFLIIIHEIVIGTSKKQRKSDHP